MISEKCLTEHEQIQLINLNLTVEMAIATEWVIRDNDQPDSLIMVYVAPTEDAQLQAACSCIQGTKDLPCAHALAVFQEIRDQNHILEELMRRRPPAPASIF